MALFDSAIFDSAIFDTGDEETDPLALIRNRRRRRTNPDLDYQYVAITGDLKRRR